MRESIEDVPLNGTAPGTQRLLRVHRFGVADAGLKAYVQAGLHADELPGMVVARHLIERLRIEAEAGNVAGEVVVVPVANPIGLDQMVLGRGIGRFALSDGGNFNRAFADLGPAVVQRLKDPATGRLDADPASIRVALRDAVAGLTPTTETAHLRRELLRLAIDADVVLDLHCDDHAEMHLYTLPDLWDGFRDLAARLGCHAALLAEISGGDPFDEACSGVWNHLRRELGDTAAIGAGCAATTIELRGKDDVSDRQASVDAAAILDHLRVRGVLRGEPPPAPPLACAATPLAGVERVIAPTAGIQMPMVRLGDEVRRGDVVAEILDPWSGARTPCRAGIDGTVWTITRERWLAAGDVAVKLAGQGARADAGANLLSN